MIEPTGYTALDLIGFTDRGGYDPDAYYVKNDIVTVGNTKWRCKVDDTTGITPTEGANWTIYLESATSLAGMDDVTLTSPKNGDGLVHDGNDWKNIPIMTKEQWKKNGAYNLCPIEATTQVVNGVTYTVNADGTISTSGATTTNTSQLTICNVKLPKGTYKAVRCPTGGSSNPWTYYVILKKDNASGETISFDTGDGGTFTLATDTVVNVRIIVSTNIDMSGKVFKPMLTADLNATYDDYVEYAKTNRELTEELKTVPDGSGIFFTKATGGSIENNASWAEKYGKVIVVNIQAKFSASASSPTLGTLSIKPKYMATTVVVAGGSLSTVSVNTSSGVISLNGNISSGWIYGQLVFVYE